jgi:hypothetical protein
VKRAKIGEEAKARALSADMIDRLDGTAEAEGEAAGKRRNIYMTDDLLRRAKVYARRNGLSVSSAVRLALNDFLGRQGV